MAFERVIHMKKILLASVATLALSAGTAMASSFTDQIVAGLQSQGFARIEILEGTTQVKVEAIRGTTKLELIYDLATGAVLKQETATIDGTEDVTPGVEIETEDGDFITVSDEDLDGDAPDDDPVDDMSGEDDSDGSDDDADEADDDAEDDADEADEDTENAADEADDDAEDAADEADDVAEDATDEAEDDAEDAADEADDDSNDDSTDEDESEDESETENH